MFMEYSHTIEFYRVKFVNIFIDALSARDGGGVTYIYNLLSLFPNINGIKVYILIQRDFEIFKSDKRIVVLKGYHFLNNPIIRYIWHIFFLKRILKKLSIDIFFVPGGISFIKPPKDCKLGILFRNMLPFDKHQLKRYPLNLFKFKLFLTRIFILDSIKKANFVIYISKFGKNFIHKNYPFFEHKYKIIPHGIDEKFYKKYKREKSFFNISGKYMLYVSRLEYYKNQLELVKAFSRFTLQDNQNIKLVLVGPRNTTYGKIIENYIYKKNLNNKVLLLGSISHDNLPKLYQNSEINFFLSEVENCPNILLEALASKRPIICSKKQPMIEFGKKALFYCDPGNVNEIFFTIKKILNNKKLSTIKSKDGFNLSKLYSKNKSIKKTWQFLLTNNKLN